MTWSKNGTPNTLSSSNTTVNISDLTASEFNVRLFHGFGTGGDVYSLTRLNGNTGNNYGWRRSINGGADSDYGTQPNMAHDPQNTNGLDELGISYWINIDGEEKLMISFWASSGASGVGTAPSRAEAVGKFNDGSTNPQVTQISVLTTFGGSYNTGSNLTALNGDTTEETILGNNVQSGSRFEATDTRKIYYGVLPSVTFEDDFSSDSGWTHSSQTSVSGGVLNWDHEENTSNVLYYTTKSLGTTLSDTKWVMTFDLRIDNLTLSGSIPDASSYGLYLSSSSANADYHDALAFAHYFGSGSTINKFRIYYSDSHVNTYLPSSRNTDFTTTPTASTTYYITLVRESATSLKGYIYSDSARTTLLDSQTLTIPSTVTSLAYVRFIDFDGNDTGTFTPTDGHIDNIKVYDGVTSTDFTWTEEV